MYFVCILTSPQQRAWRCGDTWIIHGSCMDHIIHQNLWDTSLVHTDTKYMHMHMCMHMCMCMCTCPCISSGGIGPKLGGYRYHPRRTRVKERARAKEGFDSWEMWRGALGSWRGLVFGAWPGVVPLPTFQGGGRPARPPCQTGRSRSRAPYVALGATDLRGQNRAAASTSGTRRSVEK